MAGTRTHEEQQKLLLEIIKRFDGYINATNSKIAVVLSCCTAYIGGLGFKPVDLSDKREHDWAWWGLLAVSLLSVLSTLVAGQYAYPAARSSCKRQPPARHTRNPLLFFLRCRLACRWPRWLHNLPRVNDRGGREYRPLGAGSSARNDCSFEVSPAWQRYQLTCPRAVALVWHCSGYVDYRALQVDSLQFRLS